MSVIYVVYDEQGNERDSVMVGDGVAGDEFTAELEMEDSIARMATKFGRPESDYRIVREEW